MDKLKDRPTLNFGDIVAQQVFDAWAHIGDFAVLIQQHGEIMGALNQRTEVLLTPPEPFLGDDAISDIARHGKDRGNPAIRVELRFQPGMEIQASFVTFDREFDLIGFAGFKYAFQCCLPQPDTVFVHAEFSFGLANKRLGGVSGGFLYRRVYINMPQFPIKARNHIRGVFDQILEFLLPTAKLLCCPPSVGDVPKVNDKAFHGRLVEQIGGHHLRPAPLTALVLEAQLMALDRTRLLILEPISARPYIPQVVRMDELVPIPSDQLFLLVAEDVLNGGRRVADNSIFIDDHHCIVGLFDKGTELAFAFSERVFCALTLDRPTQDGTCRPQCLHDRSIPSSSTFTIVEADEAPPFLIDEYRDGQEGLNTLRFEEGLFLRRKLSQASLNDLASHHQTSPAIEAHLTIRNALQLLLIRGLILGRDCPLEELAGQ